jgi:hypothetical protein
MSFSSGKLALLVLIIAVVMLPLKTTGVFSFDPDNRTTMGSMQDSGAPCDHPDICPDMPSDTQAHEQCCSDHCDSSFGAQICVERRFFLAVNGLELDEPAYLDRIPDPVVEHFLRPPLSLT